MNDRGGAVIQVSEPGEDIFHYGRSNWPNQPMWIAGCGAQTTGQAHAGYLNEQSVRWGAVEGRRPCANCMNRDRNIWAEEFKARLRTCGLLPAAALRPPKKKRRWGLLRLRRA